jgi:hypothetical protein
VGSDNDRQLLLFFERFLVHDQGGHDPPWPIPRRTIAAHGRHGCLAAVEREQRFEDAVGAWCRRPWSWM